MALLDKNPLKEPVNKTLQHAIGLGYQFIAATVLFVGAGYYLDQRRGGGVGFTLLGVALTFIYGGYEVWKLVVLMNREDEEQQKNRPAKPPTS